MSETEMPQSEREQVLSRRARVQENFLEAIFQIAFVSGRLPFVDPPQEPIQRLGQLLHGILTQLEPTRVWLYTPAPEDMSTLAHSFPLGRTGVSEGEKLLRVLIRRAEGTPGFPPEAVMSLKKAKDELSQAKKGLDALKSIFDPPAAS